MKTRMHKTAVDYAVKFRIRLARFGAGHFAEGYYYLPEAGYQKNGFPRALSIYPTAKSAITMMRKFKDGRIT